ncbi:MAG TPA: hypothetical protein VFD32_22665 [Dehalococcoidia bacterium]|nr:hypothetical protein [Dehalococcoidia bacterium]
MPSPVDRPLRYIRWTTCRHCGLPYALRHERPRPGHACSVASGCLVIMPFRRCPNCDATVHDVCPEEASPACPAEPATTNREQTR